MNKTSHFFAVTGAAVQLLIPITLAMSLSQLRSAVTGIDLRQSNNVDHTMAQIGNIQNQMETTFEPLLWGFGLAIIGVVLFAVAITRFRYRQPWAFWFASIYGGCLILLIPVGTPFGLFLLIFALTRRAEFGQPPPALSCPPPVAGQA